MITAMIHLLFSVGPSGPPRESCGELFRETARYAQEMPGDRCEKWAGLPCKQLATAREKLRGSEGAVLPQCVTPVRRASFRGGRPVPRDDCFGRARNLKLVWDTPPSMRSILGLRADTSKPSPLAGSSDFRALQAESELQQL